MLIHKILPLPSVKLQQTGVRMSAHSSMLIHTLWSLSRVIVPVLGESVRRDRHKVDGLVIATSWPRFISTH